MPPYQYDVTCYGRLALRETDPSSTNAFTGSLARKRNYRLDEITPRTLFQVETRLRLKFVVAKKREKKTKTNKQKNRSVPPVPRRIGETNNANWTENYECDRERGEGWMIMMMMIRSENWIRDPRKLVSADRNRVLQRTPDPIPDSLEETSGT